MDILKSINANQVNLVLMPGIEYNRTIVDFAKVLSTKRICYVTFNKTVESLKELFNKNKVNVKNMFFIDAITKSIKEMPSKTNTEYYLSPGSLTEVSLTISMALRQDIDFFIFDSLTNLFSYQGKDNVEKFILTMINQIRQTKAKAVLYALDEQEALIPRCCMFVDNTLVLKAHAN